MGDLMNSDSKKSFRYKINFSSLILAVVLMFIANNTFAWKPVTHVYLALQTLDEILSSTTRFGNSKPVGFVPIYKVNYSTGIVDTSVIGFYPVEPKLLRALQNHRSEFIAGVIGPDGYPDMVTGQGRVHVETPVYTTKWLDYLWDKAQTDEDEVLAFVTGYITHAAGDMFMHTFVNHYAGGPFDFVSSNMVRHILLEGYVAKRAPSLDADLFNLSISNKVTNFIYKYLVDASKGTYLQESLFSVSQLSSASISQRASVPLIYSMLKDGLKDQVDFYDKRIREYDLLIAEKRSAAEDCGEITNLLCAPLYVEMNLVIADKALYESTNFVQTEYLRTWVANIEKGLKAWPAVNHEIAKALFFNSEGIDLSKADSLANDFKNRHLLAMSGIPEAVGGTLLFIEAMKEMIFPNEIREQIEEIKAHLLDQMLGLVYPGLTRERIETFFKNPELHLEATLAAPDPLLKGISHAITLTNLNKNILGLEDIGYQNPNERFDPYVFPTAFNTITMTKLLMISEEGITQLVSDIGCTDDECEVVGANAMLGFIKSLDGDNAWRRADGVDWQPELNEAQMVFASCDAFSKLFLKQMGDNEFCPTQLATPQITPESGEFNQPITVAMNHTEPGTKIYYTVSETNAPFFPSDDPNDSRSHLYSDAFQIAAISTGEARPLVYRAKAFKNGFVSSNVTEAEFTVDAKLITPILFPNGGDFSGFVNVTITVQNGVTAFYTTNGTTPDFNSTRYTGQFNLGIGEHIVKAIGYRIGYTQTNIITKIFNVYNSNTDRVADVEFTPFSSGNFTTSVLVKMLSRTQNSEVRYTIAKDQVPPDPTDISQEFTAPFTLELGNWFIRAKAFKTGLPPSNLNQINYNISNPLGIVNNPVIEPNGGLFFNDVDITLTSTTTPATAGIRIFYTTDGTEVIVDPQKAGNYKNKPFKLRRSSKVRTAAGRLFFTESNETSADFTLQCATPTVTPASGTSLDSIEVVMSSETNNAKLYYTTDGSEPNEESTRYTDPFYLTNSATLKIRGFKNGYSPSNSASVNFTILNSAIAQITKHPISQSPIVGSAVKLYVKYTGTPKPQVQWQFNNVNISGATSDTLILNNVKLNESGNYRAIVSNASGAVTSNDGILNVLETPVPPVILVQPIDLIANEGDSTTFSIVTSGIPKPTYLWFRNGSPLNAQIGDRLTFANTNLSHVGDYQVQVSNSAGLLLSDQVMLTVNLATGVSSEGSEIPNKFELFQNYPNPFNPTTTISFAIAKLTDVKVSLYDILGREIAILVEETLPAGNYKTIFDATGLASGTYFYRMETKEYVMTKKILFIK